MDYIKQSTQNYYLYDTQVENLFISEYLPSAPENAVKVYLLALMHAQNGMPIDSAGLAKKLHISAQDVDSAWDWWYKQGLVRKVRKPGSSEGAEYGIELFNIREMVFGRRPEGNAAPEAAPFALDDAELSALLKDIEKETGRLLESKEPEEVASWIYEYGMAPEVILLGYRYCTSRGKSNRCRYVGSILKDWRAKGLTTADQVEDSLAAADRHYEFYRAVMKELGFHRSASEPEKRIMDNWFDKMDLSLDEVMEACRKTTGISNPNINYVNSILVSKYNEKKEEGEAPSQESLFAKVDALYEQIRQENARKTEQRRSEVFARIPRVKVILDEMRACSVDISRAMLRGGAGTSVVAGLREKSEKLGREKAQLLGKFGYSADVLDAVYSCGKCKDTGVLDDGSRCSCFKEKAEQILNG